MENRQAIFEQVYALYRDRVYRLCLGYTRHAAQAEDLVQECFCQVWTNLPQFQARADIGTWVYRIAANTCLMQLRRQRTQPVEYRDEWPVPSTEPEQDVDDPSDKLYRVIATLPEVDRIIISMVLEDVPQRQIGEVLGITENHVNVKVHRIKQKLKEALTTA